MDVIRRWVIQFRERLGRYLDEESDHEGKLLIAISVVLGALTSLVIVAFVVLTEHLSARLASVSSMEKFAAPIVGSLLGGWLLFRFFPGARGSGIPQTRMALLLQHGIIDFRTVLGKFICSSISLGSGVALGREGPSVHIGAGIASVLARKLGLSEAATKALIPVGTAAAVAAAFNTPLAAVLFTLEEILADLHARVVGAVVVGAAVSWMVLRLILGDEPLFHVPAYQLVHPAEFGIYAFLGLAGGVVSTVFVKFLLWQRARFLQLPNILRPFTPAAGGLVVAVLALITPGVMGVGYDLVNAAVNGQMAMKAMLLLLVLKVIATATCYGSGNAGGVFGPSLFIGAMLGGTIGHIVHSVFPDSTGNAGAYALVGMGAAFAGIIRTPMTSVIMIFELTRDYSIIVPLMIANLCSYFLAQRWQRMSIYESLAQQDGIKMPSAAHVPPSMLVEAAMRPVPPGGSVAGDDEIEAIHPDDTLDSALQRMGRSASREVKVLSRIGAKWVGVLSFDDAMNAYAQPAPKNVVDNRQTRATWLGVIVFLTFSTLGITMGTIFWQRSQHAERAQLAYREGKELMIQGRSADAVLAFQRALAEVPVDNETRSALGLALVGAGHPEEAFSYLAEVAKVQSLNGPVQAGLARAYEARGDTKSALYRYALALNCEWPADSEGAETDSSLAYASLLAEAGRKGEAVSVLLGTIERSGDDRPSGKLVLEKLKQLGSTEQVEQAAVLLTKQFPADGTAWFTLGDLRMVAGKDTAALAAYRRSLEANPENPKAIEAVRQLEAIIALDPTARGLSSRERARRWDEVLRRVIAAVQPCDSSEATAGKSRELQLLLAKKPNDLESADQKMEQAIRLWTSADAACKADPILLRIFNRNGG